MRVLALLRERLPVEPDEEVRLALVEAAGRVALRHRPLAGRVAEWLTLLVDREHAPGLRLAALAQLARCSPDALPRDVVPVVSGLLRQLRCAPGGAPEQDHQHPHPQHDQDGEQDVDAEAEPDTEPVGCAEVSRADQAVAPTLVGQLRALSAQENAGRGAPWAADLLRTLHVGLDDRVGDRTALLIDQLRSPDRWQRIDAVRMSGGLMRAWRGSYEELVALVGDQLSDPEPRLAEAASHVLEELFSLAAPTADALAARLAADPGGWVKAWASGPPGLGSTVKALARLGDARAVPALAAALELPEVPHDVGFAVGHLGPAARPLAGALRRRLAGVALDEGVRPGEPVAGRADRAASGRGDAGGAAGAARRPGVPGEWLRTAALRALGSFGPAAREAVPELRAMLRRSGTATEAAEALWAVAGDRDAVLPVLIEGLQADQVHDRRAAAAALGALGPHAAAAAPRLRGLLAHDELWLRVDAAIALWEVTGRPEESIEVLLTAWEKNRHVRVRVAECLARMGPLGPASTAAQVLRAQLACVRRHNALDGGYGSHDTYEDEKLLALCRQALRGTGKGTRHDHFRHQGLPPPAGHPDDGVRLVRQSGGAHTAQAGHEVHAVLRAALPVLDEVRDAVHVLRRTADIQGAGRPVARPARGGS
ncbi:PBS lyase OS=Streptomyces microflavus OX=1919 GN=HUT09_24540 PE=4 SV=1 [Streptomyces microflavus]